MTTFQEMLMTFGCDLNDSSYRDDMCVVKALEEIVNYPAPLAVYTLRGEQIDNLSHEDTFLDLRVIDHANVLKLISKAQNDDSPFGKTLSEYNVTIVNATEGTVKKTLSQKDVDGAIITGLVNDESGNITGHAMKVSADQLQESNVARTFFLFTKKK